MEIIYTFHAEEQLKERKILKIWIKEAIKTPDMIKHSGYKYYIIKKLNGRILKVVYVKENYIKVITSFFIK